MFKVLHIPAAPEKPMRVLLVVAELEPLQKFVGGQLEAVLLYEPDAYLYCNEDGRVLRLPLNLRATVLAICHSWRSRRDYIVGDVIVAGPADDDGNDTSVPDAYLGVLHEKEGA